MRAAGPLRLLGGWVCSYCVGLSDVWKAQRRWASRMLLEGSVAKISEKKLTETIHADMPDSLLKVKLSLTVVLAKLSPAVCHTANLWSR